MNYRLELKLDYDTTDWRSIVDRHRHVAPVLQGFLDVLSIRTFKSASGKGWHVEMVAFVRKVGGSHDLMELALQAILGSDPRREAHNMDRLVSGWGPDWNRLWDGKASGQRKEVNGLLVRELEAVWSNRE